MRRLGRWAALALLGLAAVAQAEVKLPRVFASHMVLQRDLAVPVWGFAAPGEDVSVTIADRPAVTAKADAAGQWQVKLAPMPAGGPFQVTVKGTNEVVLDDVLVGEVWLCSGQSNMEMVVQSCLNPAEEVAASDLPRIRQFGVPKSPQGYPASDLGGGDWVVCSPATAGRFTACGLFMARELQKQLDVPIGLLNSSWGGTLIEPWTAPEGFAAVAELKAQYERVLLTNPKNDAYKAKLRDYLTQLDAWMVQAREALAAERSLPAAPPYPTELRPMTDLTPPHQQLSVLYNGMIKPILPYGIRGAIWYQGESNHREGMLYTHKMRALIEGWRKLWGQGDFPFYYVQIAPYNYGGEPPNYLPEFWEAQAAALSIPSTGMVVTNDIADLRDIHPKNKQEVGRRLALLALRGTYGKPETIADGPVYKSLSIEGDKIRVTFDHVGGGLVSRDGQPLNWWQIIGEDTDFVDATAVIEGNSVVVSSPQVTKPRAITYGWHRDAEPNLANKEGLPARPFRAGEVPKRDFLALRIAEAKDYQLVYDLDLAKLGANPTYDVDNRERLTKPFDRIAYFLELQKPGEQTSYVYVSMDAFTADLGKIGLPTFASKAKFQQKVANVTVISNAAGIVNGTSLQGCNIEFWPDNYGGQNGANIPNASGSLFDFGDQPSAPEDGYGCMQVHNYDAKQTIFAINQWKSGNNADLGIGNSSLKPETRDWTFCGGAGSYSVKRLRVLVHEKP